MRVLLDCRMATWTGVGRYTLGLTRALAARGDLELFCVTPRRDDPPAIGASIVRSTFSPLSPMGMLELGGIQAEIQPDLTHCLHFPTPFPARRPLVVTLHDLTPLIVAGVMPSFVRRNAYRFLNRRAASFADAIIVPSSHTASDVERLLPAAAGKVHVTPEGADDFADGPQARLTGRLQELTSAPYVLSMGSTRAHKDLPTLLRAFARLAPAHSDLRVVLVGAGGSSYVSETLAESPAEIQARVSFTGRVTDDELRSLYSHAAAFAFPSRYEGFGLPPLEAMALGAPVVCSTAASLPEVVGEAALTHEPGDDVALATALERVLTDAVLRDSLLEKGLTRARELTWAAAAQLTVDIYQTVVRR